MIYLFYSETWGNECDLPIEHKNLQGKVVLLHQQKMREHLSACFFGEVGALPPPEADAPNLLTLSQVVGEGKVGPIPVMVVIVGVQKGFGE